MATQIQPFTQTTTNVITSFSVSCRSLNLFVDATFTVDSFDASGNLISRQVVPITTEQYLEWNNNDSFIVSLMAQILGYTIISSNGAQASIESGP